MHRVILSIVLLWTFLTLGIDAKSYCTLKPPQSRVVHTSTSGSAGRVPFVMGANEVVATAWYPGWRSKDVPVQNIPWTRYSSMVYAFAVTTPDPSVLSLEASDQENLPLFVQSAHNAGVNAVLSIGGWSGSVYFSKAVSTPQNRALFVLAITGLVTKYDLDGIDFDWEYPNRQGIGCNTISASDSANFLAFLQLLRQDGIGKTLLISAAVGLTPFAGPDGTPMKDVSPFAGVINYIEIMAYDVWGSWSATTGPNAPLDDSCAASPQGSAMTAAKAWTQAGFPASQIVLGVAAYGHSFHVSSTSPSAATPGLYSPFDKAQQPAGDAWDDEAGVDQCGNQVGPGGIWNFWGLVQAGYLDGNGTAKPGEATYTFDNCSQTPYLYDTDTQTLISYDDPTSFAAKGKYINDAGLRGFAMWDVSGDYKEVLIDSISDAIGVERVCIPDAKR